ncbi:Hypothetical protein, putative [Bodo saltans]|uniref:EF-hand domain-containing protein n=1 Tax=Bodo saltans TaxID=75058 RepID=A0A0S4JJ76_BODSA|nr:Hypothetical protein, putative [Bodo saltans]|eukprot:CUG90125.1 Hypothetical protein, putative [Bodo saltans]
MRLSLCVVGDNVDLGAQLVDVEATTGSDLVSALGRAVRFSPVDYNKIVAITRFSPEHNLWVGVSQDIAALAQTANLKIHVICEKNSDAVNDALFLEVLLESVVAAALGGGATDSSSEAYSALRDAKALFRAQGGGPQGLNDMSTPGTSLFRECQRFLSALRLQSSYSGSAATQQQSSGATAGSRNKSAAPPRQSVLADTAAEDTSISSRRRAAAPAMNPDDVAATRTSTASATTTTSTPAQSSSQQPYLSTASSVVGTDALTVFCVYSGTTSQRAKAFKISRSQPSIEALLQPLRQKFSADLALGFIAQDGSCNELLQDGDLLALITQLPPQATSLTLHCWTRSGVAFDDQSYSVAVVPGGSAVAKATSSADAQSETSVGAASSTAAGPRKSARPTSARGGGAGAITESRTVNKSSRPSSVTSVRSYKSTASTARRQKHGVDPNNPLDSSGVAWTTAQLEQLFDKIDVDGSGCLSKQEFFHYMSETYDDMGVPNFKKKIAQLIDSAPEFVDGGLAFNEFSVIMLKVAQW